MAPGNRSLRRVPRNVRIGSFRAIVAKIQEVDHLLHNNPIWRDIIREIHPEICLFFLNGKRAMREPKKRAAGRAERISLLRGWCGEAAELALKERTKLGCHADDIVDAFATLWTAERIHRDEAVSIPPKGGACERDCEPAPLTAGHSTLNN